MKETPIKYIQDFEWLLSTFKEDVYRVGGSLQPRPIRDYDYLVFSEQNLEEIKAFWKRIDLDISAIISEDNPEYFNKKCIIKFKIGNDLADVIYVRDKDLNLSIKAYMDCYFPLSIQRVALCLKTRKFIGTIEEKPKVIYYRTFCSDNYLKKYKNYYPYSYFELKDF